jgi:hypothetical protein
MVLVRTTVDVLVQVPFAIVHLKVAGLVVTVTEDVRLPGVAIVAAPAVTVQVPVSPVPGVFAAMANRLLEQFVCAGPAIDTVGIMFVSVTVEEVVQVPLVMVHRKTAGLVVTVTAEVREVTVVIVAAPLTTLQAPVSPVAGALAAMVNVAVLHLV